MLCTTTLPSHYDRHRAHRASLRVSVGERLASKSMLARYLEGWAEADPVKIADATADDYDFYDPLVGHFSRRTLPQYFALLRSRFAIAGVAGRGDLAFALRGPMSDPAHADRHQYWRDAPLLGLTGVSEIVVMHRGVAAEAVAYDLNIACETLRGIGGGR
ncbi:MAG TPA: hypothetical protein VG758_03425 [Hyphomicrobiaceae bacterium]|jgi:hypothetical protein|nr:hypothetical protein [Hyphomicrobiaceae bacterium]